MAQTLKNSTVKTSFSSQTDKTLTKGTASYNLAESWNQSYANGTAVNQANRTYGTTVAVAAASTASIDLSGGVPNPLNGNEALSIIKELVIVAAQDNPGDLLVGGGTNGFISFLSVTSKIKLQPGGMIRLSAPQTGYTVTAGTGDLLIFDNADADDPCNVSVYLVGVLA